MRRFRLSILTLTLIWSFADICSAQMVDIYNPFAKTNSGKQKAILFAPITHIGYIEKGDKIQHSDSISSKTTIILTQKIKDSQGSLDADSMLSAFDTTISNTIQYELNNVVNDENFVEKKKKFALPPYLDSLLMESGYTYGLIFYQNGFLRKKGNYGKQVWKSIGLGVLTMGNYIENPHKSSANLYLFLLDGRKKTITCIGQNEAQDQNPTDPKLLDKQLQTIIENKNK